ncbi:MAG: nucleoside-diphosphate kinase [Polyangiales bacterium]|jgi:nucleoside-diphosphate kinase
MATERTLSIIKPDAVEGNHVGAILNMIEKTGLKIVELKMLQLSKEQAEGFYAVHKERPFFGELVEFMMRSPVVVSALEGDDAVAKYRTVMGATNPAEADEGTIRKSFSKSIGENSVHGSDSLENAGIEIKYFFS